MCHNLYLAVLYTYIIVLLYVLPSNALYTDVRISMQSYR